MYKRVIISLYRGRNPIIFSQDVRTSAFNILRSANAGGHRALGTASVLCAEVNNEPPSPKVEETKKQEETPVEQAKATGKENLLALLGNMKVEVTTKRRPKLGRAGPIQNRAEPRPGEMDSTISMFQKATAAEGKQPERETLSPTLVAAASAAAACLPDSSRAESELLQQLRQHEAVAQAQAHKRSDGRNLGNIIANMKVGRRPTTTQQAGQHALDDDEDEGAARRPSYYRDVSGEANGEQKRKSLLGGKRLNIFSKKLEQDIVTAPTLSLWDLEFASTVAAAVNKPPRNGFEEMIEWTKEGKLWKFPIDNEAGLEEEAHVPFHEHVFLERHLEDGFPQLGPVRHFMELVVTGLAKNPHLTVRQKVEHISWFREYFCSKEELLNETGALNN